MQEAVAWSWVWKTWGSKWQPTPVFLPGKSHGCRSLVGYGPWGCRKVGHALVTKQYFLLVNLLGILGTNLYYLRFCWILFDYNKFRIFEFPQEWSYSIVKLRNSFPCDCSGYGCIWFWDLIFLPNISTMVFFLNRYLHSRRILVLSFKKIKLLPSPPFPITSSFLRQAWH